MARRRKKKGRARNITIVSVIAIIILAGAYYTVPEVRVAINSTGLITPDLEFPIADEGKWTLPTVFKFAIGDFDGVHCIIQMDIAKNNKDGSIENFIDSTDLQVELLEIIGGSTSSAKPAQSFTGIPKLSCWDTTSKRHAITLAGGFLTSSFQIGDPVSGLAKTLVSRGQTIPSLNKNLNIITGGGNVALPTIIIQASAIESFLLGGVVPDSVAEKTINIFFNTKGFASIIIDGTVSKAGDLKAGAGGTAKFLNPDFDVGGTGTGKGTNVIIQSTVPTQFYYLGSATPVPSGVNANQVIRDGGRMTITVTGVQDNWSSSEGQPTLTIKSPTGATITSSQMSFSRSITGGLAEFKTTVTVPIIIGAPNIDLWKGTWSVQMKQAGRLQVGSSTFALGDNRAPEFIPPPPEICQFPKIIIGGECVDQPPDVTPTPDQCPSAVDLLLAVRGLTNDELRKTWFDLVDKGTTLDVCEVKVKPLVETEMVRRGFSLTEDPTEPTDPTQPPIIPAGSAKAYIRYAGSYTDVEATMLGAVTESCKNDATGIVPPQGLQITGFQLLGLNACDGFRFGSVELIPTLDFGTGVSAVIIDKDSFAIKQELIISVNQPIPNEPTFACTTPTSSNPAGTCAVTNFAQVSNRVGGLGGAGFSSVAVTNFVDKQTSGEYQIVKTDLRESLVIDKIQRNGVVINDGDKIDVLYYIYGTFRGTHNGENFVGKLPFGGTSGMLAYVQHYEFDTSIGGVTCELPSKIVILANTADPDAETRLATGDETGQCTPCDELETLGLGECPFLEPVCEFPNTKDLITGECKPPDDDTCPMGEIRDLITGECRESSCQDVAPMCVDGQFHDISTTEVTDCGVALIICVDSPNGGNGNGNGNGEPIPNTCPSPLTQYRDSLGICVNIDSGTCPMGQARNSIGVCEETGRIVNPEPPTAPPNEDVNLCSLDKNFNIAQCLASLFTGDGTGGLQLTGATLIGVIIFVVVIIAIIIIAVIVRRRGGGLNI